MFKDSNITALSKTSATDKIIAGCNGCSICRTECAFLSQYGNPGTIAALYQTDPALWRAIAFECSLCGLCRAVCPQNLDPAALFLDFRREALDTHETDLSKHQALLAYERKGISRRYSYYSLPENCDTIFFPGCTLTGTRPGTTLKTYAYLQKHVPRLGIVLDCCTKPSHDLGRQAYFEEMFFEMEAYLIENRVKTIIVACPNCHKIFHTYGRSFRVETAYDLMAKFGIENGKNLCADITLHDPCPVRFETRIHAAVRSIVQSMGLSIIDTPHREKKTFCCGEGGTVACVFPGFADEWREKRTQEASARKIATYCAGCVNFLSKKADTFHILDLVFEPEKTLAGNARVSRAPFTYLNRLNLKRKLKKLPAAVTRERTDPET